MSRGTPWFMEIVVLNTDGEGSLSTLRISRVQGGQDRGFAVCCIKISSIFLVMDLRKVVELSLTPTSDASSSSTSAWKVTRSSGIRVETEKSCRIITSTLGDCLLRIVFHTQNDAHKLPQLFYGTHASKRTVPGIGIQTKLFQAPYTRQHMEF